MLALLQEVLFLFSAPEVPWSGLKSQVLCMKAAQKKFSEGAGGDQHHITQFVQTSSFLRIASTDFKAHRRKKYQKYIPVSSVTDRIRDLQEVVGVNL